MVTKLPNHPEYYRDLETFIMVDDFLDGSRSKVCTTRYIYRYITEEDPTNGKRAYQNRLARTYNKNHVRPYADIHLAHLARPVEVGGADDDDMQQVLRNADGYGRSIEEMLRIWAWHYLSHGRVGVLVDAPIVEADTRIEAENSGIRSFQLVYPATHIRYWEYFMDGPARGQLKRVVLFEQPVIANGEVEQRALDFYRVDATSPYFADQYRVSKSEDETSRLKYDDDVKRNWALESDFELISSIEGPQAEIPFVLIGEGLEDSLLRPLADNNLAILNLLSTVSNIVYNQGFQRNIVAGETIDEKALEAAHEAIMLVIRGTGVGVTSIPPGDPTAAFREIGQLEMMNMRQGLMQTYQLLDDTRQVQSAESKSYDAKARIAEYNRIVDQFEEGLLRVLQYHAAFEGSNPDTITVSIGRDYGLEDREALGIERQLAFTMAQGLGVAEVTKTILKTVLSDLKLVASGGETEDEVKARLYNEIDSLNPDQAQDALRSAAGAIAPRINLRDVVQI